MNTTDMFKPVTLTAAAIGIILGVVATFFVVTISGDKTSGQGKNSDTGKQEKSADEPLYWVAPMDPNYRRDKPGKSPMGMDLIPVYEQGELTNDAGPGTINIAPNVVNNLGVRTAMVKKMVLTEEILTVGYVKYDENKLIHIHPRVSGWIDKLYVKATGEPVKNGEPLYSLYSPELVNAQEELILALTRNNSRLIKAAEDRLKALQISSAFIKALKQKKTVEQSVTFYSPQDGVIDNLNIREGFYVQPGTMLFSIGALDRVWVEAEIFERQAAFVKKGAAVSMTLDYLPGEVWQGQVDYVYPTLDSVTRTVRLRLQFDNPEKKLLPNMFAQVVISSQTEDKRLLVPCESLIRTGERDLVVLALGEGSFKSIAVTAGRENQQYVEIIEGLSEGEEVVSSAQFLLDSESSKTSDFMRMAKVEQMVESVWVAAVIEEQMKEERLVRASHDAIEDWNMMAMTMNFSVAEEIDFDSLLPGTELHMQIQMGSSGIYEITGVHIMSMPESPGQSGKESSEMGHSEMEHSGMNHPEMDNNTDGE